MEIHPFTVSDKKNYSHVINFLFALSSVEVLSSRQSISIQIFQMIEARQRLGNLAFAHMISQPMKVNLC